MHYVLIWQFHASLTKITLVRLGLATTDITSFVERVGSVFVARSRQHIIRGYYVSIGADYPVYVTMVQSGDSMFTSKPLCAYEYLSQVYHSPRRKVFL